MNKTMLCWVSICLLVLAAGCNDSSSSSFVKDSGPFGDGLGRDAKPAGTGGQGADGRLPDASGRADGPGLADSAAGGVDSPATAGETAPAGTDAPAVGPDGASATGNDAGAGTAADVAGFSPLDGGVTCGRQGALCQSSSDCCGLACVAGQCSATACRSDGLSCSSAAECCSTQCGPSGTCVPLNPTCKTAGNACTSNAECCNHTCNANHQCASPGDISFCAQAGDLCRKDGECCTGVCVLAAGAAAGTCATISTSCKIDGTECNGCGDCCSHFCGPFGAGGPSICQPASGCHVQGDLCRKDSDCCGGDATAALPGSGLIKCMPDPTYGSRIGTCGNPSASNCPNGDANCRNACNPEGNVCHYKQTLVCAGDLTNVRNDCCQCISGKDCCQPDATGIPRCNALGACVPVGGTCSFSGECCNHEPCLPDPVTGRLTCGSACVQSGGACTTNADCCSGLLCQASAGSVAGVCVVPVPPPVSMPDAGSPPADALPPVGDALPGPDDAGLVTPDVASEPDAPLICSYYGQDCSATLPCCGTTLCRSPGTGALCTDTDTDCLCYTPE